MTVSVVVPTFQRPDWIGRSVSALAKQTVPPLEVLVVARDTDIDTHRVVRDLEQAAFPFSLRALTVSEPGFLPPVREGFLFARGDVVAVTDDDAEAHPEWIERMLNNYRDRPDVEGVGGRVINVRMDGTILDFGTATRVGRVTASGRAIGNMYKAPQFEHPVEVDYFMGGNMSFRIETARRLEFDFELNKNVGMGYEMDLGLQIRRRGGRLIFDPRMVVHHYSAPRAIVGAREQNDRDGVRFAAHNETRILARRLAPPHAAVATAYGLLIGYRRSPGVVPWVLAPAARRLGFNTAMAPAALLGRVQALATLLDS